MYLELCDWDLRWIAKDKMYNFFNIFFFLNCCSDLGQFITLKFGDFNFLMTICSRPRVNESRTAIFVAKQCSFAEIGFGFGLPWSIGLCKMCTLLIITQVPLRRDFTDVTLVSEDGQHPAAHSVILAASIPRMRDIIIRNIHHHPLL